MLHNTHKHPRPLHQELCETWKHTNHDHPKVSVAAQRYMESLMSSVCSLPAPIGSDYNSKSMCPLGGREHPPPAERRRLQTPSPKVKPGFDHPTALCSTESLNSTASFLSACLIRTKCKSYGVVCLRPAVTSSFLPLIRPDPTSPDWNQPTFSAHGTNTPSVTIFTFM